MATRPSSSGTETPGQDPSDLRLFVALVPPDAWLEHLVHLRGLVAGAVPPGLFRWVAREHLHVTLRFFDSWPPSALETLVSALESAAAPTSPVCLRRDSLHTRPSLGRPSLLWVGLREESPALAGLLARLEDALSASGWPATTETRPFRPHITLARRSGRGRLSPALRAALQDALQLAQETPPPEPWRPEEWVLFRSRPGPAGPAYAAAARGRLGLLP